MRRHKGLYKRGRIWWMMYNDGHGRTIRESADTTSQREAEYLLNCRKKAVREGKLPDLKRINNCKFVELAQDYLKWSERQRVYETKKYWIPQLIEVFGNLNVSDLNPKIIEQWQSERLKKNKPSTVNRLTACLKHMVNKGVEWGMTSEETLKSVRKVKQLKGENKRLRYLTIEELQRLLDCCHQHLKPIVLVAVHTGMRKGEILNLKWDQVDLRNNFILHDKTKNGERREIPINGTLKELFASMPKSPESEYIFVDIKGEPYGNIKCSFSTALRRAGIRDFHFHDLRHTFASHLVMAGVDLTSVKELLGHKSITMTLRYAHLAPGHKTKAVELLGGVLSGGKSEKRVHNLFTFSESDSDTTSCKSLRDMVGDIGFEPMTPCLLDNKASDFPDPVFDNAGWIDWVNTNTDTALRYIAALFSALQSAMIMEPNDDKSDACFVIEIEDNYDHDGTPWEVLDTVVAGVGPHGVSYTPGGEFAFVTLAQEDPGKVVVITETEPGKFTVTHTIKVGTFPNGIAIKFGRNQNS